MKIVKVAPGYNNVPILGYYYNQGQRLTLTDGQYVSLASFITSQLIILSSSPDVTYPPVIDNSYTTEVIEDYLEATGTGITLQWIGNDYQPTSYKNNVNRPKTFIGPADPKTVTGVVLSANDQWIDNS